MKNISKLRVLIQTLFIIAILGCSTTLLSQNNCYTPEEEEKIHYILLKNRELEIINSTQDTIIDSLTAQVKSKDQRITLKDEQLELKDKNINTLSFYNKRLVNRVDEQNLENQKLNKKFNILKRVFLPTVITSYLGGVITILYLK